MNNIFARMFSLGKKSTTVNKTRKYYSRADTKLRRKLRRMDSRTRRRTIKSIRRKRDITAY